MVENEKILKDLINSGIIGEALGALISKNNDGEKGLLGAVAGAAVVATYKAYKQSEESKNPMVLEEEGTLYEVFQGKRKFLRKIEKIYPPLPKEFKLK